MDDSCRLITEIRKKKPSLSKRARTQTLPAVRLFCLECMGGASTEVKGCKSYECALHPFRLGSRPKKGHTLAHSRNQALNDLEVP